MEISFTNEIRSLALGNGETFHGEGILAVTKALLQSGVTYVGGYQGAPVSHLLDVMVQARDYMDELGVHVEACSNEASAAAMLGASIMYPVRGAVTWKAVVGTNVASDALSNLASPGVMGGALIVVGDDYGEGASVVQERSHAFAVKSGIWLLDPRPNLPTIVNMVEHGFELSEASNTPVMLQLRIRACHVRGSFICKDNRKPRISTNDLQMQPADFDYGRLSHPPSTFTHEKLKHEVRLPAARKYIVDAGLNELFEGPHDSLGIVVQGGLYNNLIRALQTLGLADAFGKTQIPILNLNVTYPLVPEQITDFFVGKRAVFLLEEGQPEFLEQEISTILRRADVQTKLHGKDLMSLSGEYTAELILKGMSRFIAEHAPELPRSGADEFLREIDLLRTQASEEFKDLLPGRPPNFCTGCPERPVFSALKLIEREIGKLHISTDIGCHSFATFAPFSFGQSILGYGMSLASSAGVQNFLSSRPIAIMGDGGFWHNGMISGVASSVLNKGDGVLIILKNGYTSATGTQDIISTPSVEARREAGGTSATPTEVTIENTLKGLGVRWIHSVNSYKVGRVRKIVKDALSSSYEGLKVIIADGECQLERQRRVKPQRAKMLAEGKRVVRTRFGVDEDTCTGDHDCIRLSGCPTLTIRTPTDPLKVDPVAYVTNDCVGCGLCGEVAHAATLCPSFWRCEIITNPSRWDRIKARLRQMIIGPLQPA